MTVQDLIDKKDYDYISYRVTHPEFPEGVFVGSCHSINGKLIPDDQDYYSPNEEVLSYEEWIYEENGIYNGLTVVVEGQWIGGET